MGGGGDAVGPFLQGFAKPISDLSRGASVDDIVTTCAVVAASG
jgi:phosphate acetyltransferase